jgi:phosphoribosylformylglycinamidine synthase
VPALKIGTTGGSALTLPGSQSISVAELRDAHEGWFPAYMAGAGN